MSADVSAALGVPELAGCFVSPNGLTKKVTGATAAGMVAGVAGTVAANRALDTSVAPPFGNVGYLAATAGEVALIKGKAGAFKPKPTGEVIARVPRDQITAVGLDAHLLTATLTITFATGGSWEFEVPKAHRASAQQVVHTLNDMSRPAGG